MATTTQTISQRQLIARYIGINQSIGYNWRINELTDEIEVNGEPLTDITEKVIKTELRRGGVAFRNITITLEALVSEAAKNKYHPIRDYLNSLSYQGGNYISQLASYFINPDGLFETWLKRWLIGAVRRVYVPGSQNRMLVLDGPQNIGKSKFVEWLCPPGLRKNNFRSGPIFPDDKDHKIGLAKYWIWEVSELGATTKKADREALKAFISSMQVNDRKAWGHYDINKPALSNFIGTVNNEGGLLSDPTGNRRFMFCKIDAIDWQGYTADLKIDDIWAEAAMLYFQGEPADLTPVEYQEAERVNKTYEIGDPIEDILSDYYEIDPVRIDWFTPVRVIVDDILDPLRGNYRGSTDQVSKRVAAIMTKYGLEAQRKHWAAGINAPKKLTRGYPGIKVR